MYRQDPFNGLQLYDDLIPDDQIHLVSAIELQPFVQNRKIYLALEGQAAKMQFMAQALFVSGFEQSGTELAMDLDGRTNDRSSPGVLLVCPFMDLLNGTHSSHGNNPFTTQTQSHREHIGF